MEWNEMGWYGMALEAGEFGSGGLCWSGGVRARKKKTA